MSSPHVRAHQPAVLRRVIRLPLWLGFIASATAAPIPAEDLVKGFSPAIQYEIAPDGRHILRRRLGAAEVVIYPVSDGGELGEPFDLSRYNMWHSFWSRDGSRIYGIALRNRKLVAMAANPAMRGARPREIPLPGATGRVVRAGRHPTQDGRVLLWAHGRGGENILDCELDGAGVNESSRFRRG